LKWKEKKKKKRPPKRIRRRKTTKYIYIYIYIYILYYFLSHNFLPIFVSWFVGEALEPHLSTGGARNFFLSFSPQNWSRIKQSHNFSFLHPKKHTTTQPQTECLMLLSIFKLKKSVQTRPTIILT
jgi:hypothetical protein